MNFTMGRICLQREANPSFCDLSLWDSLPYNKPAMNLQLKSIRTCNCRELCCNDFILQFCFGGEYWNYYGVTSVVPCDWMKNNQSRAAILVSSPTPICAAPSNFRPLLRLGPDCEYIHFASSPPPEIRDAHGVQAVIAA